MKEAQEQSDRRCKHCGTVLTGETTGGLCPRCLLEMNLASRTMPGGEPSPQVPPPTPEEMAARFPQFEILECLGRGGMGVVLNLIPADVTSFTVEGFQEGKTPRCTKQAGGDWILADETDRAALRVNGTKLTVKKGGKELTADLADHLDIDKDVDWSKIKTFNIRGNVLVIERKPDGLDLVFQPEKNDDANQRRIRVRWEADEKPQEP